MKKQLSVIDITLLIAIFISPFKDIFILKVGIIDFKLPQIIWSVVFLLMLIERLEKKYTCLPINFEEINNNLIFSIYLGMLAISWLFSVDMNQSTKEIIQYIYLFATMYAVYFKSKNRDFMELVIKTFILSNIVMISVALISIIVGKSIIPSVTAFSDGQIYLNFELFNTQKLMETGDTINRINILGLGPIGISFYIILQSLMINYKIRVTEGITKKLLILLLLANSIVIVMGYSRIGILIFFLLNVFTLFSKDHVKNIGIFFLTIAGAVLFLMLVPEVFLRILETFNTQEQSSRYHFVFWIIALKTGYNNILTGIGLGNMLYSVGNNKELFDSFGLYESTIVPTHNFVLQIWAEQGIFGILINLVLLFIPVVYYINARFIRKTIESKSVYFFILLAFIGMVTYNLTNNSYYVEVFWEYIGLMYAMKYHLTKDGNLLLGKYVPLHIPQKKTYRSLMCWRR